MSLHNLAQHLQSAGRGDDKVLVHMTPGEVQGLQSLAMAHGGSLSINPQTGLPEAGFLDSILPMIAGFALGPAGFALMSPMQAALTVGAVGTLATGSLGKGLMAGLGAFGGAGIGGALAGGTAGAVASSADDVLSAANTFKGATPAQIQQVASGQAVAGPTGITQSLASKALTPTQQMQANVLASPVGKLGTNLAQPQFVGEGSRIFATPADLARGVTNTGVQGLAKVAPETFSERLSAVGQGLKNITSDPKKLIQFVKDNPYESAALATSLASGMQEDTKFPERKQGEPLKKLRYEYEPIPIGVAGTSERNYFPNAQFTSTGEVYAAGGGLMGLADGGTVEQMSRMNAVGANTMYPMANQMSQKYATPAQRPISENVIRPVGEERLDPYTGEKRFAEGGDIAAAYQQFLGRSPDPAGLAFYSDPSISKERLFADLSYANNPERAQFLAKGSTGGGGSTVSAGGGASTVTQQAAAAAPAAQPTSGTVNIPQGAFYYGGGIPDPFGYGKTGTTTGDAQAVESPFAKTSFRLGSQAPTIGAQTTAASPSQVADIYERVLGRQVDLPGLEFYAKQQRLAPSALEQTLQYSPEFFENLAKPLVPKLVYDQSGRAMIEGSGVPYNPAQYGYPGPVVQPPSLPKMSATAPTTTPSGVATLPAGTAGTGAATGTGVAGAAGAAGAAGTAAGAGREISTAPGAYQYNYFENKPEENALIRQYQTGPNEKARADLTELYLRQLGRLPDAPGFDYYMKTIGADNIIDPKEAEMFINNASPELADRRALTALYREVGGRDPDIPGLEYYMSEIGKAGGIDPIKDRLVAGLKQEVDMANAGYRAPTPNQMGSRTTQAEAAALQAKAPFLYGTIPGTVSSEYPAGRDNNKAREQLYNLYEQKLGRTPDMAGFNYWINEFGRDNQIDAAEMAKFLQGAKEAGETVRMAGGGIADLGGYSDGGRLLKGPGDGVSDSIPAVIGDRQPARLADGEFVIPARIVSELGNGSTDAGARKLYAMMDRIQRARKKSVGKQKVAVNSRADKYLPA